jgi:hypothetical protein
MANKKITELDAITSASTDDILPIVDAPGGSAATKKITFDNLQKSITTIDTTKTGILKAASGVISAATAGTDYLAPGAFVDRGDPAAVDYAVGALTVDGAYHDLDLSSIVPSGAKAVLLRLSFANASIGDVFYFRENGNSNSINIGSLNIFTNTTHYNSVVVACDTNRVVEYRLQVGTWSAFNITVGGWWL